MNNYSERTYLSSNEVANYLDINVRRVHQLVKENILKASKSTSGQYRFNLSDLKSIELNIKKSKPTKKVNSFICEIKNTTQTIFCKNSQKMIDLDDNSVHLVITSPPYFNAKMYSDEEMNNDLGNVHNLDLWFEEIRKVWEEVYRVLQPGRKFFLNIMNLPIKDGNSFRTLNLVGKSIDIIEKIGFIFKRDIIWQKTNGVRAHFGTYPYPGGILINNMHEFILEFNKPEKKNFNKYNHLTKEQKEKSKLDKDFWLSIKNSDVWVIKPENSSDNRKHIAPFPIELPYKLIKAFSYVGEIILDPFCGSATTLIAASFLERNGIGYDINNKFIDIANKRLIEEKNKIL